MDFSLYKTIDPISIFRDLIAKLYIVILLAISVGMLTYVGVTLRYESQYTTQTTFIVANRLDSENVYTNLNSAKETADRFKSVLEGVLLQKAVMEDLGLDSFPATCKASQIPETNMITLSVTAGNPKLAFQIMQSILNNYGKVSDYIVGSVYLTIIEQAVVPVSPVNPLNTKGPVRNAVLVTIVLLFALFTFMSIARDTVKNEEQLKDKIDAYHLGTIYHERKTEDRSLPFLQQLHNQADYILRLPHKNSISVSMLITNPVRSYFYVEACRSAAARIRARMDRNKFKTIIFTSVMENEGKSTVSANVALSLAEKGKKVLLIDADFRKPSVHKLFRLEEADQVDLLTALEEINDHECIEACDDHNYHDIHDDQEYHGVNDEQVSIKVSDQSILEAKRYKNTNLYLLANSTRVNVSEHEIPSEKLGKLVDAYREGMDYIIIDTAPMALVTDTEDFAGIADASVLVIREDIVLAKHINDCIDTLNETSAPVLGCIFNDASVNLSKKKM